MDVLLRNENMMIHKHFSIGLKQVFLKLDEVLSSRAAQEKMKDYLGYPEAKIGTIFQPDSDPVERAQNENLAWMCGASMTAVVI